MKWDTQDIDVSACKAYSNSLTRGWTVSEKSSQLQR